MQIQISEAGKINHPLRNDASIADDDDRVNDRVRTNRRQLGAEFGVVLDGVRLHHGNTQADCRIFHGRNGHFHSAPARPIGLRYQQRHGMTSLDQSLQGRDSESRSSTENQNHRRAVTIAFTAFVIPSEAKNLHFAAECRSLASLGMTIHEEGPYHSPAFTIFLILRLIRSRFSALMCEMYSLPFK